MGFFQNIKRGFVADNIRYNWYQLLDDNKLINAFKKKHNLKYFNFEMVYPGINAANKNEVTKQLIITSRIELPSFVGKMELEINPTNHTIENKQSGNSFLSNVIDKNSKKNMTQEEKIGILEKYITLLISKDISLKWIETLNKRGNYKTLKSKIANENLDFETIITLMKDIEFSFSKEEEERIAIEKEEAKKRQEAYEKTLRSEPDFYP